MGDSTESCGSCGLRGATGRRLPVNIWMSLGRWLMTSAWMTNGQLHHTTVHMNYPCYIALHTIHTSEEFIQMRSSHSVRPLHVTHYLERPHEPTDMDHPHEPLLMWIIWCGSRLLLHRSRVFRTSSSACNGGIISGVDLACWCEPPPHLVMDRLLDRYAAPRMVTAVIADIEKHAKAVNRTVL